jgi:hypothetical protein
MKEYLPDHELPHCRNCGDPWGKHEPIPRRYGAACTRCNCVGYQPMRFVADRKECQP